MVCLRQYTASVVVSLLCVALLEVRNSAQQPANSELGIKFIDVSEQAGIKHKTIYGDEHKNRYLLETTGCGAAFIDGCGFFDADNNGWLDMALRLDRRCVAQLRQFETARLHDRCVEVLGTRVRFGRVPL